MVDRAETWVDSRKTNLIQSYIGQDVVESNNLTRHERTRHIEQQQNISFPAVMSGM